MSQMSQQEFYKDVDRSRYRANWSCLIWFFALCLVTLGLLWYGARLYGLT
jgi:fatty acid desaturase